MNTTNQQPSTLFLLGFGAIGRHVTELLAPERAAGLRIIAGVRDLQSHREQGDLGVELIDSANEDALDDALARAGLIAEVAGVGATIHFAPRIAAAGKPLVLTSVGALTDPETCRTLTEMPGVLSVTNGAIGGLDILEATADANGLDTVSITTSKDPSGLIQEWMSQEQREHLEDLGPEDETELLFEGDPAGAIEKFPGNVNVAAALAWATRGRDPELTEAERMAESLEKVSVRLIADPEVTDSTHRIHASGSAGTFELFFAGTPSHINPQTSAQTALSVTRSIRNLL